LLRAKLTRLFAEALRFESLLLVGKRRLHIVLRTQPLRLESGLQVLLTDVHPRCAVALELPLCVLVGCLQTACLNVTHLLT